MQFNGKPRKTGINVHRDGMVQIIENKDLPARSRSLYFFYTFIPSFDIFFICQVLPVFDITSVMIRQIK